MRDRRLEEAVHVTGPDVATVVHEHVDAAPPLLEHRATAAPSDAGSSRSAGTIMRLPPLGLDERGGG